LAEAERVLAGDFKLAFARHEYTARINPNA
jgi:hypothetical protein